MNHKYLQSNSQSSLAQIIIRYPVRNPVWIQESGPSDKLVPRFEIHFVNTYFWRIVRLSNVSVGASCCESGIMCNKKIIEPMMLNVRGDYSRMIIQVYVRNKSFQNWFRKNISNLSELHCWLKNVQCYIHVCFMNGT